MGEVLLFLAPPFAACLILVGILGYFGIHVVLRKVIFVDLALAQIAAMGAVIALAAGHEHGSTAAFFHALAATTLGAAIFAWTRVRKERVPHEAIIGITYVIASAATLVIADRAPEGAEHIKEMLAGAILWVGWDNVLRDLLLCLAVGVFHVVLRKRFVTISERPEVAFERGWSVRWWDFLFYLSFGVIITAAVEIAGVLMVFAFLVAPAIIAIASADGWRSRLVIAWSVGAVASAGGLLASYYADLPSGPAVVCTLGVMLLVFAVVHVQQGRRDRGHSRE